MNACVDFVPEDRRSFSCTTHGSQMEDVQYDNHENRLMSSLQQIMNSEQFADVTLCCADGYKLRAHKVVLSYCSSYLQTLLLGHPGPDDTVTIILQDIGHEDVELVLEFVYTGAAVVPGHRMDGFVTAAGVLGIGPLLDPRRHYLEMSTVLPSRPQPAAHPVPMPATVAAGVVQELTSMPPPPRIRQPPRTTGILTPSPWAQNSRPPCAAPKCPTSRTSGVVQEPATTVTAIATVATAAATVATVATIAATTATVATVAATTATAATAATGIVPTTTTKPVPAVTVRQPATSTTTKITDVRNEWLPVPPSEDRPTDPVPSPVMVQLETDNMADADRKPLVISDANNNGIPERDRNANQTKSHVCQDCGKPFMTKASLKIHQRTHTGEKPFVCESCGKQFSQLRNYKYHRSVHEGTREFSGSCPECGKLFNDRGYLSSHMKIHRNRKEYECEYCGKSFNQRVAYNMHVRIHTGEKPHRCHHCGKSFTRKMLLKQHLRIHTGEKPFACAVCHKPFADRSNMTLHMRLHSGVKPYACAVCGKSFTKKHHLKTHMNYHTGVKPYSCDKCGLSFSQSSNMRTHLKKCNAAVVGPARAAGAAATAATATATGAASAPSASANTPAVRCRDE